MTGQDERGACSGLPNAGMNAAPWARASPGSMGLWEPMTDTLFSGDAIYDGLLPDELADSVIPDYIHTMKRLREMPVTVVHGGHEASFGRDRLVEIADDYLAWRDR